MTWNQLLEIKKANQEEWKRMEGAIPSECPRCGYPLDSRTDGTVNCPLGDYRYPPSLR